MPRPRKSRYIPGDHWVICDRCGFAFRESETRLTWDNLVVCHKDWEPRHPQDFVRAEPDTIAPQGNVRPEPPEITVDVTYVEYDSPGIPDGTFDMDI